MEGLLYAICLLLVFAAAILLLIDISIASRTALEIVAFFCTLFGFVGFFFSEYRK